MTGIEIGLVASLVGIVGAVLGVGITWGRASQRIHAAEERVKAAETTSAATAKSVADASTQLALILHKIAEITKDLEQLMKTQREDTTTLRGKVHDARNAIHEHEMRLVDIERSVYQIAEHTGTPGIPVPVHGDRKTPIGSISGRQRP